MKGDGFGTLLSALVQTTVGGTARHWLRDAVGTMVAAALALVAYVLFMMGGYQWLAGRYDPATALLSLAAVNLLLAMGILLATHLVQNARRRRARVDDGPDLGSLIVGLLPLLTQARGLPLWALIIGAAGIGLSCLDTDPEDDTARQAKP